jgi:hypothetical protein
LPNGPVKPDALHAYAHSLPHRLQAFRCGHHEQHTLGSGSDGGDVRVSGQTVDRFGVAIHRHQIVAALTELIPKHPAEVFFITGHTDDGDPPQAEETVDCGPAGGHCRLLHLNSGSTIIT